MGQDSPQQRRMTPFVRFWLPVLLYVSAIIVVSTRPNLKPPLEFPSADKVYHVIEYLGLGMLLARALRATAPLRGVLPASVLALAIGVFVGGSDELVQRFVPGRESSLFDLLADTTGLVLAQVLYLGIVHE